MIISVNLSSQSYDIILERGALNKASQYLNLERKVLIVSDTGVPREYLDTLKSQIKDAYTYIFPEGETSKNIDTYSKILSCLVENKFTRSDLVIALGGGVTGDMAGFAAATYMRGIDFYNIPTTLLSQVDSSIGGKVAIDFQGVKNIVGAFYQPKRVIIDPNVLKTLDKRQFNAGLCEAIKMAATCNSALFEFIEKSKNIEDDIDKIIEEALLIKKDVVEKDPHEKGLRRVLNFGHTIGHAIESYYSMNEYLHGECVAIGMLPMSSENVAKRLKAVLEKYNLPTEVNANSDAIMSYMKVDKKAQGDTINIVYVEKIGEFEIKNIPTSDLRNYLNRGI